MNNQHHGTQLIEGDCVLRKRSCEGHNFGARKHALQPVEIEEPVLLGKGERGEQPRHDGI